MNVQKHSPPSDQLTKLNNIRRSSWLMLLVKLHNPDHLVHHGAHMIPGETILSARALGQPEDPHVSAFQVMQSPGNRRFYIGTSRTACGTCDACKEDGLPAGFSEPNSRETEYFDERSEAEAALTAYLAVGKFAKQRHG